MTRSRRPKAIIIPIVAMSLLGACASNEARVGQFDDFAKAGAAYTESVDTLLDASLLTMIRADNQVLIRTRSLVSDQSDRADSLREHDDETIERGQVLGDIRRQTDILKDYFLAVGLLANSEEGSAVADATSGLSQSAKTLAGKLRQLSGKIDETTFGEQSIDPLLDNFAEVAVAAKQRKDLEEALKATAKPVSESIEIHKAALEAIRDQMTADFEVLSEQERTERIGLPFVNDGDLPNDWGQRRTDWLRSRLEIAELDSAVAASDKLQLAFQALLENRAEGQSFDLLLRDLNGLVDVVEKLT